jgi:hypothetical protein
VINVLSERPVEHGRLPRSATRIRVLSGPELGVWILARSAGLDDSAGPWARADGCPPDERMTQNTADALHIIGRVVVLVDEPVD